MRSLLRSALAAFALGAAAFGCNKPAPPPPSTEPRDVTLSVPGMN
jgi:hypothetical protein